MSQGKTEWGRLALETAAIVFGILLAFAIEAWWGEFQENEFEAEAIAALIEEYERNQRILTHTRELNLRMRRATAALISACHTGTFASAEFTVDEAIYWFSIPPTTDLGSGVRDTLMSSGQLELITDDGLRYKLAEWQWLFDELRDDEVTNAQYTMAVIEPHLVRQRLPRLPKDLNEALVDAPLPGVTFRTLADDASAQERLFGDLEFLSIAEARYDSLHHTTGEFDRVLETVDEMLGALRDQAEQR